MQLERTVNVCAIFIFLRRLSERLKLDEREIIRWELNVTIVSTVEYYIMLYLEYFR